MKKRKVVWSIITLFLAFSILLSQEVYAAEEDKGYIGHENSITVNILPSTLKEKSTDLELSVGKNQMQFEKVILDINQDYDQKFGEKISRVCNDNSARSVNIYEDDLLLLNELASLYNEGFLDKKMPDLSAIYNIENQARKENMYLLQAWMYQTIISNSTDSILCESKIEIKNIDIAETGVREYVFQMIQDIESEGHKYSTGNWCVVNIIDGDLGPKIISVWVNDTTYLLTRDRMRNIILTKEFGDLADFLQKDIFNTIEQSKNQMQNVSPIEDEKENEKEKVAVERARKTLVYDRNTVAEMAITYAINHNPRFYYYTVAEGGDCTNFISQSIWQSPGWPFDKIGINESVKWSCKKENGKYYRETPSWSGVNEFYDYCRWNDNLSLAGTVYGISAKTSGYSYSNVQVGDIIQFQNPYTNRWQHSMIVSGIDSNTPNGIYLCGHGGDAQNEPLSVKLGEFQNRYRVIHINNYIVEY